MTIIGAILLVGLIFAFARISKNLFSELLEENKDDVSSKIDNAEINDNANNTDNAFNLQTDNSVIPIKN